MGASRGPDWFNVYCKKRIEMNLLHILNLELTKLKLLPIYIKESVAFISYGSICSFSRVISYDYIFPQANNSFNKTISLKEKNQTCPVSS